MTTNFPLSWPHGWKRTGHFSRQRAKFSTKVQSEGGWSTKRDLTVSQAVQRLDDELARLGAVSRIISSNVQVRLDGTPRSGQGQPVDPGVAVYFTLGKKERVLACDKWDRVEGNIAAIAAHIDAIRRQDRYGVGTLDQAFAGYEALPPPGGTTKRHWSAVLDVQAERPLVEIEMAYKAKVRVYHENGSAPNGAKMAELNAAIDEARSEKTRAT